MKKAVRVLMAVLMVMMFSSLAAADITYETQWSVGNPSGIAVGPSNDVYVASATNNLVQVYNSSGNFLTQWIVNNPTAIAVNSADDVYVASATNNLVQVYDSSGNFLTQWTVNNPTAIAVNSADDVYVASATGNLVQVYDSSGNFLTQWTVNNPTAIAVNSADDVYVADATGNLITVFNSNGGYLNQWDVVDPSGLSVDPSGNIFVADFKNNFILVSSWNGAYLDQWGNAGTGEMQFAGPASIAINQAGNVYVADMGNDRVQSFSISHTITSTTGANGTISPLGTVTKNSGDSQAYAITPDAGYRVVNVAVDTFNQGSITTYTFSNINRNHTIAATFELDLYAITSTAGDNGTISPVGITAKNAGDSQTYTITPAAGYRIASVVVDTFPIGAVSSYTFSNITRSHTITASFTLNTYTITSTLIGTGGTITPVGTVTKNAGDSQTYTITPAAGYRIASVVVDTFPIGAVSSYTFSNITRSHTITASFTLNTYTITSTLIGTGGTITPVGTVTKNAGDSQTYTITPAAGYRIASVVVDTFPIGAVSSYTFSNITRSHTITASFTLNTYTITSTLIGTGGTITPVGTVTKNAGDSQTYTITPAAGYRIASVVVDTFPIGAVSSYTFSNITRSHTITASFTLNTYTITSTLIGTGGTITPVGTVTKNAGDSQTYTITPAAGYRIASVVVDTFPIGAVSSYTFSNITRSHTISVTFAAN